MHRIGILLAVLFVLGISAPVAAVDNHSTQPWVNDMNEASYWGKDCIKYEKPQDPFVITIGPARLLVLKAGSTFVDIWGPAPRGEYGRTDGKDISWAIECKTLVTNPVDPEPPIVIPPPDDRIDPPVPPKTPVTPEPPKTVTPQPPRAPAPEPKFMDPRGKFVGPCGDPWYAAIFDNTRSERAVSFRFIFIGEDGWDFIKRTVAAGKSVMTSFVWTKSYTIMKIRRGNGENLRILDVAPPGFYGWEGECQK